MGKFEEELKTVITTLCSTFEDEVNKRNAENIKRLKEIYDNDKKMFLEKCEMAQHEFTNIIENVIEIPEQENMYILEYILSGLYEHFIKTLIQKKEGSCCCADKSGFVKNMTLKALKENKNLSLYDDYTKCEQITEDKEQQAYWSPKTIKDTDMAMEMFWKWYSLGMED